MFFLFSSLYNLFRTHELLLVVMLISCSVKTYFLSLLIPRGLQYKQFHKPWLFLLGVLIGSMFGDIAWMIKIVQNNFFSHEAYYSTVTFFIRIAWGFLILQYQSLSLFIESLTKKNFTLKTRHKVLLVISGAFSLYFFYIAFFSSGLTNEHERELAKALSSNVPLEIKVMRFISYYLLPLVVAPGLYFTFKRMRNPELPQILRKQLFVFIQFLICPYLIVEFIQAINFAFKEMEVYMLPIVNISTLLLIYAIYYCMQRVMGLRFLNFNSHVQSDTKLGFIDDFKNVLEQLSYATSPQELNHITQTFFKDAFSIPPRKSMLYVRKLNGNKQTHKQPTLSSTETTVENFINSYPDIVDHSINKHKVLIHDELAFSNFYEEEKQHTLLLSFLEEIKADVFLPIYEREKIIAYIVIDRHARANEFYTHIERDELVVFARYLGNIVNVLQNRSLNALIHQEKELKEELHSSRQEINQYKESIRSFLRNSQTKEIGVIFYKNRRFVFGNQTAKEIIKININTQEGHPLTKSLKQVARKVEEYKSPQTCFAHDHKGRKLVLSGVPNLEQNNVIITVYYPEISDIITKQINLLKDPTLWDYLLYLETTKSGLLINQLIPGSGEAMLNFKIDLLKTALSKKAILLHIPEDDITTTVELIHHISSRQTLHTLELKEPEKNFESAIELFGINTIFSDSNITQPLLERLDGTGTLFIKNIEFLHVETQKYLSKFIHYGIYRAFKSDQKFSSNIRIICSSQKNLTALVQESVFSKSLFEELQEMTLTMPPLSSLSEQELCDLADAFTKQAVKTETFDSLLSLSDKEKEKLVIKRPESLKALKNKVQQILVEKSKKSNIFNETQFDPAYEITDPELTEAARLGKHALRDPQIMIMLWNKFKSQNKIATFLGVNRSSVNRRCKKYNLL